ncbi:MULTISPECIES: SIMPL domain-containing protein [Ruminococcus]|uniref:Uncharacterized conserved protein YggE, contains kinase-interacting SIMPL domain n=1 Tax=Ruminococcus flavefaciens TaxID=1265 RepID=A0A1M7K1M4_RUMFL|nr:MULTISPECIES: SIMPL domain-containing protein [Ruminococcus]MCR4796696.1 SIMPL domain-containing protein [Ruminococcus sp.]SHM58863.1 Uncharacterized conserved protein YggE, contains kinase-interacting SIMPL domain [Ruminococcus flavefaciens]
MSRLSVTGTAEIDFPVDIFKVTVTIRANAPSSGEVIQSGKKKTEQFLALMQKNLGIEPDRFQLDSDSVNEDYSSRNSYNYTKRITLDMKAELSALSKLTSLLEELSNVEYDVAFYLSDEADKEKQVIDAAINNSREKAEMIASSLGKKIEGVEEIRFEHPSDARYRALAKAACADGCNSLETMLKLPTKTISKSIYIDWIME